MLPFTVADIQRQMTPAAYERGVAYQRSNRVTSCHIAQQGHLIRGEVIGSGVKPYTITVQIRATHAQRPMIVGHCSCAVQFNCKHSAALLIQALLNRSAEHTQHKHSEMPATVSQWIAELAKLVQSAPADTTPKHHSGRLLYLLSINTRLTQPLLEAELVMVRIKKDGLYGKPQPFRGSYNTRYISDDDRAVLRWLNAVQQPPQQTICLQGKDGAQLLQKMILTGRCHWQSKEHPPLTIGDKRRADLRWEMHDDGTQELHCRGLGIDIVLPLEPPYYIDSTTHQCGSLDFGVAEAVAALLVKTPRIPVEQIDVVTKALAALASNALIPLPRCFRSVENKSSTPVPQLKLFVERLPVHYESRWDFNDREVAQELARLSFNYDGHSVGLNDQRSHLTCVSRDTVTRIARDFSTEQHALQTLDEWGFIPVEMLGVFEVPEANTMDLTMQIQDREYQLTRFMLEGVARLRQAGWVVDVAADFPYRPTLNSGEWYIKLSEHEGQPWFDLELGVEIDGQHISLLPILHDLIQNRSERHLIACPNGDRDDQTLVVHLPDGRLVQLPANRLDAIQSALLELSDSSPVNTSLRLHQHQIASLAHLEQILGERAHWYGGQRQRQLAKQLQDFSGIANIAPPHGLQARLRPYQQQGFNWLQFLRCYELGGILADDMGLGKTVQALAHILCEKESGRLDKPALVVAPTSLMMNWYKETQRFAPALRVLILHGALRKQHFASLTDYDLLLTTYPLLSRDQRSLEAVDYHLLILDEAQNIKNPSAKASQIVRRLRARHHVCLTGTPLENHLGELWSQFDFLMPGLLGSEKEFRRLFRTPIEKMHDKARQDHLKRRVAPFILRRTKQHVAKDLPAKTESVQTIELAGSQRDLYETIRLTMHEKVRAQIQQQGLSRSHIVILDALLKLRQVCCDPRLLKWDAAKKHYPSAKLEWLLDTLPELIAEGRRILLFSQFTSMLSLIEAEMKKHAIAYLKLTGETRQRGVVIDKFQNGKAPLFLISLKAGGTGLNLTAADTVIHYDPWWNPAVEHQATDRAHRIGQDKPVFVYKLITNGTVEEKILALQAHKQALADTLLDPAHAGSGQLSLDDLTALFEPLQ